MHVLFIMVVYGGFVNVSLILFKEAVCRCLSARPSSSHSHTAGSQRSYDFTNVIRSAQMVMGYC